MTRWRSSYYFSGHVHVLETEEMMFPKPDPYGRVETAAIQENLAFLFLF